MLTLVNSFNPINSFNPVNSFKRLVRLSRSSISFVYLVRPSRLCYAVRPSRLCYAVRLSWFVSSISFVYLVRPSRLCYAVRLVLVRSNASILVRLVCVMLCVSFWFGPMRPSRPSRLCYAVRLLRLVCACLCCPYNPLTLTLVYSFKHVKRVNSFKRLVLLVSAHTDPLNYSTLITTRIIRAFRSVYLLEHCNALKSISLSEEESPRGSKCLTRLKCSECTESMERLKGFEGFGDSHNSNAVHIDYGDYMNRD